MRAKMVVVLLVAGGLACLPVPLSGVEPTQNPFPDEVKATGRLVFDRSEHDPCLVAAPPVLKADIEVTLNTVTGTITGTIGNGQGAGDDLLVCPGDDSNERYIATISFTGIISGRIDVESGGIVPPGEEGNVTMTVSGSGERGYYPDMPEWSIVGYGGGFVCGGSNAIVPTCSLGEFEAVVFPAQIGGVLTPMGELIIELDWIAPFCVAIKTSPDNPSVKQPDYSPENCPSKGRITWTDVVLSNQRPVIESLSADPANPVTTDVVNITVKASDPENEKLTYQWTVDGERQQIVNSPTTQWTNPSRGNHAIEVRVIDPSGGYDEAAIDIWVEDPSEGGIEGGAGDDGTGTTGAASTTTTKPAPSGTTSAGSNDKPSKGKAAGGSAVLVAVVALAGDALRKGKIRGKAGELYRWGEKKAGRGRELAGKVERAQAIITDPTILLKEGLDKATKRVEESSRGRRAKRRIAKAQQRYKEAERKLEKAGRYATDPIGTAAEEFRKSKRGKRAERRLKKAESIATNPLKAALERVRESRRGRRLERRGKEFAEIATDPYGALDRSVRKKAKEYLSRIRSRARKRVLESGTNRRYRRLLDRLNSRTKGILNAQSTARLIRSIGNPRRFSREVRNNPTLVRHVIRRAGLSPLAVEALGGPRSIGRMLGRVSRNPGRELRRVGRFLGKPKGWAPEIGRGVRRIGRGIGRLFRF